MTSLTLSIRESKEVIMLGDLNPNYLKKNENIVVKELFSQNGFKQTSKKSTRTTKEFSALMDVIESFRFDYDYDIFYLNLPFNHVIFLRHHVLTA